MLRRDFLLGAAGATALALPVAGLGAPRRAVRRIGIQLYTLRVAAATDPLGTLRRLKAIGYDEIELGGPPYSTMDPQVLRREVDRIGLKIASMHVQTAELEADPAKVMAQARTLGARFVVLPWLSEDRRSTIAQCEASAKLFDRLGAAAKAAGVTFAYHNHAWEFAAVEGRLPFDIFFGESDLALAKIELDLFWVTKAKVDPATIFARYPGRIPLVHVKDMLSGGGMTEVGAGTIDFAKLFALPGAQGIEHYFIEHDEPAAPYWPSVTTSYLNLKRLRY